jgi:hypothetical protein
MVNSKILFTKQLYPNPDIPKDVIQVTVGYSPDYYYIWKGMDDCVALGSNSKFTSLMKDIEQELCNMVAYHETLMQQSKKPKDKETDDKV